MGAVLVLVLAVSRCASVASGSHQNMRFNSTPQGATVLVYDEHESVVWTGETPVTARMSKGTGFFRGANYRVEVMLDGYEPESVYITPELNESTALDASEGFVIVMQESVPRELAGGTEYIDRMTRQKEEEQS